MDDTTIYDRWDQFMYLLSAQPRRQIISSLMDARQGDVLPLPDAAITPDIPVDPEPYAIELRNRHLPLLPMQGTSGGLRTHFRSSGALDSTNRQL